MLDVVCGFCQGRYRYAPSSALPANMQPSWSWINDSIVQKYQKGSLSGPSIWEIMYSRAYRAIITKTRAGSAGQVFPVLQRDRAHPNKEMYQQCQPMDVHTCPTSRELGPTELGVTSFLFYFPLKWPTSSKHSQVHVVYSGLLLPQGAGTFRFLST